MFIKFFECSLDKIYINLGSSVDWDVKIADS